ncbi:hypothetical protein [Embleya hyalina]|uniref:Uncharacterized protein n=1 Tax=Embleya hyalina TaxID=516124 RepID=A0A401YYZ7_9ACTN|nr:hypothetical protein [Embleya hyalina]GCD99846.1 hypothetical protein EHYA_07568 [Embleya hyalina]
MPSPTANKRKGYRFEKEFVDYLVDEFPDIDPDEIRRNGTLYGSNDRGDIQLADLAFVFELKNVQTFDLAGFCKELEREIAAHPEAQNGAVVIKARLRGIGDSYGVMPIRRLLALLRENRDLKRLLAAEREMRKHP